MKLCARIPWLGAALALSLSTAGGAALAYDVQPGRYQINTPDIPQETLDAIAAKLQGVAFPGEGEPTRVKCLWFSFKVGGGEMSVTLTNVKLQWNNADVRVFFHFKAVNKDHDMLVTGDYNSLWILKGVSGSSDSCTLDVAHEWSDVYNFSLNAKGIPGEVEQCVKSQVEDRVRKTMDEKLGQVLGGLDESVVNGSEVILKECASIQAVTPVSSKGDVVVRARGTKTIQIAVKNTGESRWSVDTIIGIGLLGDSRNPCTSLMEPGRWRVPRAVDPGQSCNFEIQVKAPPPGESRSCQIQMIRDADLPQTAAHWFGQVLDLRVMSPGRLVAR